MNSVYYLLFFNKIDSEQYTRLKNDFPSSITIKPHTCIDNLYIINNQHYADRIVYGCVKEYFPDETKYILSKPIGITKIIEDSYGTIY
jgi:hypothetical protein